MKACVFYINALRGLSKGPPGGLLRKDVIEKLVQAPGGLMRRDIIEKLVQAHYWKDSVGWVFFLCGIRKISFRTPSDIILHVWVHKIKLINIKKSDAFSVKPGP